MKELIIIGAGPAGISAALYAKRANVDTKIIYLNKSSLMMAHEIENYYGIERISGQDLFNTGLNQARNLNIPLIEDEVVSLEFENRFKVITKNNTYEADAILLALGAHRNIPPIKNIKDYEAKGVSYCAICDGFFYRKKKLAIIGNGAYAYHEAEYLSKLTDDLVILTNGNAIIEPKLQEFKIIDNKISLIVGDDKVEGIKFDNDDIINLDGIFVALGSAGSADLARKLGIMVDNQNKIITDENMRTNIPGIYAAGDDTKGLLQVSKAVYEGAQAATDIINFFRK